MRAKCLLAPLKVLKSNWINGNSMFWTRNGMSSNGMSSTCLDFQLLVGSSKNCQFRTMTLWGYWTDLNVSLMKIKLLNSGLASLDGSVMQTGWLTVMIPTPNSILRYAWLIVQRTCLMHLWSSSRSNLITHSNCSLVDFPDTKNLDDLGCRDQPPTILHYESLIIQRIHVYVEWHSGT